MAGEFLRCNGYVVPVEAESAKRSNSLAAASKAAAGGVLTFRRNIRNTYVMNTPLITEDELWPLLLLFSAPYSLSLIVSGELVQDRPVVCEGRVLDVQYVSEKWRTLRFELAEVNSDENIAEPPPWDPGAPTVPEPTPTDPPPVDPLDPGDPNAPEPIEEPPEQEPVDPCADSQPGATHQTGFTEANGGVTGWTREFGSNAHSNGPVAAKQYATGTTDGWVMDAPTVVQSGNVAQRTLWTAKGAFSGDVEIVAKILPPIRPPFSTPETIENIGVVMGAVGDPASGASAPCATLMLDNRSATPLVRTVELVLGSGHTVQSSVTTLDFPYNRDKWYQFRLKKTALRYEAKVWEDGTPEPAEWMLYANLGSESGVTAGYVGVTHAGGVSSTTDGVTTYYNECYVDTFAVTGGGSGGATGTTSGTAYTTNFSEYADTAAVKLEWEDQRAVADKRGQFELITEDGVKCVRANIHSGGVSGSGYFIDPAPHPQFWTWNKVPASTSVRAKLCTKIVTNNSNSIGAVAMMNRQETTSEGTIDFSYTLTVREGTGSNNSFGIDTIRSPFSSGPAVGGIRNDVPSAIDVHNWHWTLVELFALNGSPQVRYKVWQHGATEPAEWIYEGAITLPGDAWKSGTFGWIVQPYDYNGWSYIRHAEFTPNISGTEVVECDPTLQPGYTTPGPVVPGEPVVIDVSGVPAPISPGVALESFRADGSVVLDSATEWWMQRLTASLARSDNLMNPAPFIAKDSIYALRTPDQLMLGLASITQRTKDPRYLPIVRDTLNGILGNLRSSWLLMSSGAKSKFYAKYENDGKWRNFGGYYGLIYRRGAQGEGYEDPAFFGTDTHVLDEVLAHEAIACATFLMGVNADLDPSYLEAFKKGVAYLLNNWEPKWVGRIGRDQWGCLRWNKDIAHNVAAQALVEAFLVGIKTMVGMDASVNIGARDRVAFRIVSGRTEAVAPNGLPAFGWGHMNAASGGDRGKSYGPTAHKQTYLNQHFAQLAMMNAMGLAGFADADMAKYANTVAMCIYNPNNLNWIAGDCANDGKWSTTGGASLSTWVSGSYPAWTGTGAENYIRRGNGGPMAAFDTSAGKDTVRVLARSMERLGQMSQAYPTMARFESTPGQKYTCFALNFTLAAAAGFDARSYI